MSGISLDGTRYFCVSPLEIDPALVPQRQDHEHVKTERVQQFGCACCQPDIARLVASLGGDIYGPWDAGPAVQHYIESDSRIDLPRGSLRLAQRTNYPWEERVELGLAMLCEWHEPIAAFPSSWARWPSSAGGEMRVRIRREQAGMAALPSAAPSAPLLQAAGRPHKTACPPPEA